jgi:hypothetical protein
MTLRTLLVSAAVLAVGAVAGAETTMTISNPGESSKTVNITDDATVSFADGKVEFAKASNAAKETFLLTEDTEITFNGSWNGVADVAADLCSLRLRQNPVGDLLEVVGNIDAPARLQIYAISGSRVMLSPQWQGESVDVSALTPGLYILKINNNRIKFLKS